MGAARVLVLDDDDFLRSIITERLSRSGFAVTGVTSVAEARAEIHREAPDIALLDVKLPDGEGYDVIRRLNARLPGAKTVIVTGLIPSEVHLQEMALSGIADVVQKPFTLKEMEARLRRILQGERV